MENTRIANYCLKAHFCREHFGKRGVAIFVREDLETSTQGVTIGNNEELTLVWSKYLQEKTVVYSGGLHRVPAGQLQEALYLLSTAIEETKAELHHAMIVVGDINNADGFKIYRNTQMLNKILRSHNITRLSLSPQELHPHPQHPFHRLHLHKP